MGIVLEDVNLHQKSKALATDLNQASVKLAKEGKFNKAVLDEYTRNYREYNAIKRFESYYTVKGDISQFNTALISHAQFRKHNLLMEPMQQKFDIIFCRNVMIYFDTTTKLKLLKQFHQCLNDGGYVIIGFYDALMPLMDEKMFQFYDLNTKIFRKI